MEDRNVNIDSLLAEIESLKSQLFDANNIINAIKEGEVDALVLHNDGVPQIYSLESADYTYRILIEKFSEGALSITHDGLILYCNDYFCKLLGISADKVTGSYFSQYFDLPQELKYFIAALDSGKSKGEITLKVGDRKLPVYISFTDLRPTVAAVGVVVTDLSEKKKHEEALLNYQHDLEMKVNELNITNTNLEQFIHVISHDLKEPLRKILMYTSRLDTSLFTEEEQNPVDIIKSSALRLNSLVDDLVKYAFSAIKDEVAIVDLNDVLEDVQEDLELLIKDKQAKILSVPLPKIQGSKVQMRQLFANLITNAIKYSREDVTPQISIGYELVEDKDGQGKKIQFHKITLTDNGIGMEKSHLSKIFTIFQRLHLRTEYSGNGIGLAICKKIMENHSGKIEVQSETGMGSSFSLYFPTIIK